MSNNGYFKDHKGKESSEEVLLELVKKMYAHFIVWS